MGRNPAYDCQVKDMRREQILSHALELFAKNGLIATKITDIASAAGISHGLLYHYYRSKEELYTELISGAFERLNAACVELENMDMAPRDKITFALDHLIRNIAEDHNSARYHVLIAQASISDATPHEAKEMILDARDLPYQVLARIIRNGQVDGSIRSGNADEMAVAFWTAIKGIAFHRAIWDDMFIAPGAAILSTMFISD